MINRHDSIILHVIVDALIPFIQIFAIYVLFHGHYSPGGGFQAGVLIGAAMILEMLVGTRRELKKFSIRREFMGAAAGVGLFLLVGIFGILANDYFFNYEKINFLGTDPAMRRYWSILIAEIGVTFAVAMTLVVIFNVLAFLPSNAAFVSKPVNTTSTNKSNQGKEN